MNYSKIIESQLELSKLRFKKSSPGEDLEKFGEESREFTNAIMGIRGNTLEEMADLFIMMWALILWTYKPKSIEGINNLNNSFLEYVEDKTARQVERWSK